MPSNQTVERKRFSWPMRVFLVCFIGDMIVRSLLSVTNYDESWHRELHLSLFPKPLPTAEECQQIADGAHPDGFASVSERYRASFVSLGPYFSPIPTAETGAEIDGPQAAAKYAITWIASRLTFFGSILGVDQDWPMFSPSVADDETIGRIRLTFADGSTRIWRTIADPQDVTWFFHGLEEKRLQAAIKVASDVDSRLGYCNWLAHKFPVNEQGASLRTIEVFKVYYVYPAPGVDAAEWMKAQAAGGETDIKPFWVFDVASHSGKSVD